MIHAPTNDIEYVSVITFIYDCFSSKCVMNSMLIYEYKQLLSLVLGKTNTVSFLLFRFNNYCILLSRLIFSRIFQRLIFTFLIKVADSSFNFAHNYELNTRLNDFIEHYFIHETIYTMGKFDYFLFTETVLLFFSLSFPFTPSFFHSLSLNSLQMDFTQIRLDTV